MGWVGGRGGGVDRKSDRHRQTETETERHGKLPLFLESQYLIRTFDTNEICLI